MDEDQEEKTEEPSFRKINKAHEEGDYPQSKEVPTVLAFFASVGVLYFYGPELMDRAQKVVIKYFHFNEFSNLDADNTAAFMFGAFADAMRILMPVLLCVFVAGVAGNVLQVGFHIHPKALAMKLDKFNPVKGFKRVFSLNSVVEGVKSTGKLGVVVLVAYVNFKNALAEVPFLLTQPVRIQVGYLFHVIVKIAFYVALLMIVFALLDLWYQRWQFNKKLRMTKKEKKDEHKETEGNPEVKGRQRRIQMQEAMKRMMEAVPQAEVVITNPTEYAVALSYDQEKHQAPLVVAKGQHYLAQRIRALAEQHNVPIVENKPVARSLYRLVDVGAPVPVEFYKTVAEILAYVYRIKDKVGQWRRQSAAVAAAALR